MQLTKFGHACVRLEGEDGRRLVIDPGVFTDPSAVEGAKAILVTHEHVDHFVESTLRAAAEADPEREIWTNASVAAQLDGLGNRVHEVGEGDAFTAAGFEVRAYGTWHAVIHPDIPRVHNVGFLVGGAVFHPGDALTVPEQVEVGTLLLPAHAPWSNIGQVIDYVRAVGAKQAYAVHDSLLNANGLNLVGRLLGDGGPGTGTPYTRLEVGASVSVD